MKRKLTILTCFIALCSFAFGQGGNYWTTNPNNYDGSMTLVAVINIDGEEQRTTQLEIGAFCSDEDNNEELRGNTRLVYKEKKDRYYAYLTIYGEPNDVISFKIYNHDEGAIMNLLFNENILFEINGDEGSQSNPYQINFSSPVVNVAKIGDVEYTTLEAAFDAAETGDEVVVLNDIILPATSENGAFEIAKTVGNVTLNLNGFDITSSERIGYTGRTNYAFDNYANLTIKGEGTITARGIQNYGTLTIEGNDVTIISNDEIGDGACIWGYQGSATIIEGGTFRGLAKGAGAINTEGSLEITGGTFSAEGKQDEGYHVYTIICQGADTDNTISGAAVSGGKHGVIAVTKGAKLTIDNVTATRDGVHGQSGHVLYVSGGELTVNGGTFVNEDASAGSTVISTQENSTTSVTGGTFTNQGTANVISGAGTTTLTGGTYSSDVNTFCAEGYAALPDLNGNFIVGTKPTATVNNLGSVTIPAGDYSIWNGSFDQNTEDDGDMPLSFVMQFIADQNEEDMATSPFADWYGDFVLTFTGIENGSFTADGCYLAGHYGSFGWVKIPVDGMKIEDDARYPVMLGVGLGQKYDYICSSVEDFKCALYLTPEILEANPNIQVNLELAIVDNSNGSDAAASALVENENVYKVVDYKYDAIDFNMNYVARIDNAGYTTLTAAVEAAQPNETIKLINNAKGNGIVINKSLTIDFAGFAYTFVEHGVGDTQTKSNGFQIKKDNNVTLKNGTLNVAEEWKEKFYILIQNYSNLTVENMKLDGTNLDMWSTSDGDSYVISNNSGSVNITGNTTIIANDYSSVTPSKAFAFDACDQTSKGYALPVVTVNTTGAVTGAVEVSATLNIEALGEGSEISYISIDGKGQLFHNGLTTTIKKHITGTEAEGWYTISSPVGTVNHDEVVGLLNGTHDLYYYNEKDMMWENVKDTDDNAYTTLQKGQGYLYANTVDTDLLFNGLLNTAPVTYSISYTEGNSLAGFNLIGNPFTYNITKSNMSGASLAEGFYTLSNQGAWQTNAESATIAPMQGALIKATEETTANFTIAPNSAKRSESENNGQIKIEVSNDNYNDVAYVSFNEGIGLDKIEHRNANIPMVYVPVDGVNYAIATMSQDVTEIPVSFRAMTMGQYTIGAEAQDCEYAMMTLVDRFTGIETNLLIEDYTFIAKSNDSAERFIIKLAMDNSNGEANENFAFINNGMMYIYNIEGQGTVSVYDVTGRPVAEYNVATSANISTSDFAAGMYIIRMSDENGVKTQKIVIE